MTARLTIAIPTYNRAKLLVRALESALAQNSDEIEILVSDNGSTDDTEAVLGRYSDRRLRKIRREQTVTRAKHGELIFSEISTEFVLPLSDDDYIEAEFANSVLDLFRKHPELSFVYTGCLEHYDDQVVPAAVGPEIEASLDFIAGHFANKRQVFWCACVTRMNDLRRIGPQPDDRIIGDMFFWTKIAFQGPVGCVARPLSHYTALRPGGDNESRTTPIVAWAMEVKILQDEVKSLMKEHGADRSLQISVARDMDRYWGGSTANQFVWARLSGSTRLDCLKALSGCAHMSGWSLEPAARLVGALFLPRGLLRRAVVRSAKTLAKRRSNSAT